MSKNNLTKRCDWAKGELDIVYHDTEWGKPAHDEKHIFEMLILEGMQAGLSWSTILNKRDHMRVVFHNFDPHIIAEYTDDYLLELLKDPGIIRNKLKVNALRINAKAYIKLLESTTLNDLLWSFVDSKQIVNSWNSILDVPAQTDISAKMSKELLRLGFKFVGPTICYALMQAIGIVNDHMVWCSQYNSCMEDKNI